MGRDSRIRLFVEHPLAPGQSVALTQAQAHYLFSVMRLGAGDSLRLFNGRDGEWRAEVAEAGKKGGLLACSLALRPQLPAPDLWLMFAPVKKDRTAMIVEKAVELGAGRIMPVLTEHAAAERFRADRLHAQAVEAAEQCGALTVPGTAEPLALGALLSGWPAGRRILWADEGRAGPATALAGLPAGPWALLTGPEGGFSPDERARLSAHPAVTPVSLGPRILRAETAAIALAVLWQASLGDWR